MHARQIAIKGSYVNRQHRSKWRRIGQIVRLEGCHGIELVGDKMDAPLVTELYATLQDRLGVALAERVVRVGYQDGLDGAGSTLEGFL
jgi:hypothetical protein